MSNETVLAIGAQISSDNGKIGRETYLPSDNDEVPLIATHPSHSQQRNELTCSSDALFLAHSVEDMLAVSFSPSQCLPLLRAAAEPSILVASLHRRAPRPLTPASSSSHGASTTVGCLPEQPLHGHSNPGWSKMSPGGLLRRKGNDVVGPPRCSL
jgi:hypothetical protein